MVSLCFVGLITNINIWEALTETIDQVEIEVETDLEKETLAAKVLVVTANLVVVAVDLVEAVGNLANQKCTMLPVANVVSLAKYHLDQVEAEKFSAVTVLRIKNTMVQ